MHDCDLRVMDPYMVKYQVDQAADPLHRGQVGQVTVWDFTGGGWGNGFEETSRSPSSNRALTVLSDMDPNQCGSVAIGRREAIKSVRTTMDNPNRFTGQVPGGSKPSRQALQEPLAVRAIVLPVYRFCAAA